MTKQVSVQVVESTDAETLQGFVAEHAEPSAQVYTDDAPVYDSLPFAHESVQHSVGEYVRGKAHQPTESRASGRC